MKVIHTLDRDVYYVPESGDIGPSLKEWHEWAQSHLIYIYTLNSLLGPQGKVFQWDKLADEVDEVREKKMAEQYIWSTPNNWQSASAELHRRENYSVRVAKRNAKANQDSSPSEKETDVSPKEVSSLEIARSVAPLVGTNVAEILYDFLKQKD